MGGPLPISLFDREQDLHHLVVNEDDYIRNHRLMNTGTDARIQTLLATIWRLRSDFNDAVTPMDQHLTESPLSFIENRLHDSSQDHTHPDFNLLLMECTITANEYLSYINKVQKIKCSARILWKSTSAHHREMLEAYIEEENPSQLQAALYESKVQFVTGMAEMMMEAMEGSIASAVRTWNSSMETIKAIANFFYKYDYPLPTESICKNYINFYWHQIDEGMISDGKPEMAIP